MNTQTAQCLAVGDRVVTHRLPEGETHNGVVVKKLAESVFIHWDDALDGEDSGTHVDDMALIDREVPR